MEKTHYTKPSHVSNEYTPQLLALFCIFYIFTYTKYFQTSLCLFKTSSVTCLGEQIQCKYIHWMTLLCIALKCIRRPRLLLLKSTKKIPGFQMRKS